MPGMMDAPDIIDPVGEGAVRKTEFCDTDTTGWGESTGGPGVVVGRTVCGDLGGTCAAGDLE